MELSLIEARLIYNPVLHLKINLLVFSTKLKVLNICNGGKHMSEENIKKSKLRPVVAAIGTGVVISLASIPAANAADNPFSMDNVKGTYSLSGHDGACGEGKCGGEGRCGEGSCGGHDGDDDDAS